MRTLTITLSLILSQMSFASVSHDKSIESIKKEFVLVYELNGAEFKLPQKAMDKYEAIELGAVSCFNHFTKRSKVDRELGEEIIDTCANPRGI